MKPCSAAVTLLFILTFGLPVLAGDGKLDFQPNDTMLSILTRLAGQTVELRLNSGEKMGGKVEKVGENLVHLSQLTGAEFYEGVVSLQAISAVTVRAKK
jgi:hypothetical protein